jgi:hypothetical protein
VPSSDRVRECRGGCGRDGNVVTRFGTIGTLLTGLREKDRGPTMSWPLDLEIRAQRPIYPRHLKHIL